MGDCSTSLGSETGTTEDGLDEVGSEVDATKNGLEPSSGDGTGVSEGSELMKEPFVGTVFVEGNIPVGDSVSKPSSDDETGVRRGSAAVTALLVGTVLSEGERTVGDSASGDRVLDPLLEVKTTSEKLLTGELNTVVDLEVLLQKKLLLGVKIEGLVVNSVDVGKPASTDGDAMLEFAVLNTGTTVTIELNTPPTLVAAAVQSERETLAPHRHSSTT